MFMTHFVDQNFLLSTTRAPGAPQFVLLNSRSTLSPMFLIRAITWVPANETELRASLSVPH
jgi:hypothetical protein